MKTHITRLIEHMIWADNIHWGMFNSDEKYLRDKQLFEKLFHIHFVQFAFLNIVTKTPLERKRPTDFTPESLHELATSTGKKLLDFVKNLEATDLEERFIIPWFRDALDGFPLSDCLNQVAMHSHYHRAQNATRFRELGGTPQMTDFIWWAFQCTKEQQG